MKKRILFFIFLSVTFFANAQKDLLAGQTNTAMLQRTLDSAMRPGYYISVKDAGKILGTKVLLKDSMYKYSGGVLRFTFNYIAQRTDSTSKGRIFFSFEQYKDPQIAVSTYQGIRTENEKGGPVEMLNGYGDEAFLQKDAMNQPFAVIREGNKIFKLRLYATANKKAKEKMLKTAKKILKKY